MGVWSVLPSSTTSSSTLHGYSVARTALIARMIVRSSLYTGMRMEPDEGPFHCEHRQAAAGKTPEPLRSAAPVTPDYGICGEVIALEYETFITCRSVPRAC